MIHPDLLRSIAEDNARAMRRAAREARHGRRRSHDERQAPAERPTAR